MADPSVNWETRVITIPQSFLTSLGDTKYLLDTDALRLALKDIEDSEGISFPDTHRHNTEVVLGGITYARFFEIINGYTVTFENGSYAIVLVGSNNNILDVTNLNYVSVRSMNSAGLIVSGSGVTEQDKTDIIDGVAAELVDIETDLAFVKNIEGGRWVLTDNQMVIYNEAGNEIVATFDLFDADGVPAMESVMERVRV